MKSYLGTFPAVLRRLGDPSSAFLWTIATSEDSQRRDQPLAPFTGMLTRHACKRTNLGLSLLFSIVLLPAPALLIARSRGVREAKTPPEGKPVLENQRYAQVR
jgi:hypothetical protein